MIPNYVYQQQQPQFQQYNGFYGNTAAYQQRPVVPTVQQPMPQLAGRVVGNFNDIQPGEIQMDGSRAYFPTADESMIFVKFWNSDGKLDHRKYVLVMDDQNEVEQKPDILDTINSRFDKLEKLMIDRQGIKQNNQNSKKEGGC